MNKTTDVELAFTPAVELAGRIRAKDISPVEVTEYFLDRIERINPKLNAYVTLTPEEALAAAKRAEKAVQSGGETGPLHGVPVSVKDLAWLKGVRCTSGSRVFEDRVPDESAPVAHRLVHAGAIVLGKTNTPEFGWLAITDNDVFGRTNNPWNLDYTPSGSSGGAAAATAAGLSPIAHGSDGGGSIRHPASFCGVFGHKPTFGLVPRHSGVDGWPTLSVNGPITRTVEDGALALDVMAGYDSRDLTSAPLPPQSFLENIDRDLAGLRVAWSTDLGYAEVDPEVRSIFESAVSAFEELGCQVRNDCPDLRDAREIFKGIMFPEAASNNLAHVNSDGTSKMSESLTQFVLKRKDILARDYLGALSKRNAMYKRVHAFYETADILLTPTMAIPPFRHPETMEAYPRHVNGVDVSPTGWHPFTYPFNITGQPAASVPCGFTEDGLPVGLQIVGRRFEDLLVLQVARRFEEARPWAHLHPPVE